MRFGNQYETLFIVIYNVRPKVKEDKIMPMLTGPVRTMQKTYPEEGAISKVKDSSLTSKDHLLRGP